MWQSGWYYYYYQHDDDDKKYIDFEFEKIIIIIFRIENLFKEKTKDEEGKKFQKQIFFSVFHTKL